MLNENLAAHGIRAMPSYEKECILFKILKTSLCPLFLMGMFPN
jgi:hypothetical protein